MLVKKDVLVQEPSTRVSVEVEFNLADCVAFFENLTTREAEDAFIQLIFLRFTDRERNVFFQKFSKSLDLGLTL